MGGEFDFGFAVDWMRKDLAIVKGEARAHDVQLPVTRLVDSFYEEVHAIGGGRWETSSLITRLGSGKLKIGNETIPTDSLQATALPHSLNALILRSR